MKIECKDAGEYRVTFLDLDLYAPTGVFVKDGVHLNRKEGTCMS